MKKAEFLSFMAVLSGGLLTLVLWCSQSHGQKSLTTLSQNTQKASDKDLDIYIRRHLHFQRAQRDNTLLFEKPAPRRNDDETTPKSDTNGSGAQSKAPDQNGKKPKPPSNQ